MSVAELVLDTARRGELHHAIILFGPAADVRREVAMGIAKALNCLNGTTGDRCAACERIERRIHPDVHFVEVAGDKKLISIEQIRDIVAGASLRPYEGRTKVFLIDPADGLSPSGSNSLLKTLEEPTRDTVFVLLTKSPDLLLPTIRSRSQQIYVGGTETRNEELAQFIRDGLARFAERGDTAALLALAATVADQDEVKDAMALLAEILAEAAATGAPAIPREKLLAAADGALAAIRAMTLNADARLVVEQALAALVV
ncbi:MAG TPA: AAA family ATPase [Thermoanaerobaculia bacterium]|jgi:DNA polymerase-3 subunit delta'